MDKNSFLMYLDYEEQFNLLSNEEIGILMKAIIHYEKTKEIPNLEGMVKMAFSFIKTQLDRDREKYHKKCEKNKENGTKGGRPKKDSITTINGAEIPEGEIEGKHFLYLIYDKKTGLHKIGETKNLKQRRYDIKKPTNDLIIIDYYIGTMCECQKYENEILEKYKKYSTGGDWFNLPQEKVKEILTKYFLKPIGYLENQMVTKKADNDNEDDDDNEDDSDNDDEVVVVDIEGQLQQKFITCIGSTNLNAIDECISYLDDLPYEVIVEALIKTSRIKQPNWKYAKTILDDWVNRKIDTLEKVDIEKQDFKQDKLQDNLEIWKLKRKRMEEQKNGTG